MSKPCLLIATRNAGKIRELRELFADVPVSLRFLDDFENIRTIAEVGETYEENATLKAIGYSSQTGFAALADDSGLEVDALDGGPGVLSARHGGKNLTDKARTELLLTKLHDVEVARRTARFVCCMVLFGSLNLETNAAHSTRQILAVTRGVSEGMIATAPEGSGGFGYDPIFIPNGYDRSFASLDANIKKSISHRALAARAMHQELQRLIYQT